MYNSLQHMPYFYGNSPGRGDIPAFTQLIKAGTQFNDPRRMQGWVEFIWVNSVC